MNKAEMKKGMLLKREEEIGTCLYRVLELEEERILVMDCVKKTVRAKSALTFFVPFFCNGGSFYFGLCYLLFRWDKAHNILNLAIQNQAKFI